VCLLWPPHGGVLLAADAAANMFGLGLSVAYEDRPAGERQLHRLAALDFRVACFGHGKAIIGDAASRFRWRWPVGSAPDAEPGAGSDRRGMSAFPDV
jgi:glyoxylase-like metal-dependent hydrolase (beta-lactamase superfamily II)